MKNAAKILVVINPKSGGKNKEGLRAMITYALEDKNVEYTFYETTGKNDNEKLKEKIEAFHPQSVLVAGGDGTVNRVAGLLAGKRIILGILPTGSSNGLAKELNIPENAKDALIIGLGEKTLMIDAVEMEGYRLSLHLSDIGLNATLIKNYSNTNEHGFFSYIKNSYKSLRSQPLFHIELTNGQKKWRKTIHMVVIANGRMYGTGIEVNPKGNISDGRFEVLLFRGFSLRNLWKRISGQRVDMETIQKDYIKIKTAEEMSFQIDGEYMGKVREVNARIVPACITVAVAADYSAG